MAFLKDGTIKRNTTTPGLKEAEEKLRIANMDEKEYKEYFAHVDAIMSQNDTIETYRTEGEMNLLTRQVLAKKEKGMSNAEIADMLEIKINVVDAILKEHT